MRSRASLFVLLFFGLLALGRAAAPPAKAPPRPFDFSKLPPGTIFIVGDEAKDALQQPGAVILSPEKFKELMGQLDQLKRQASAEKGEFRGSCKLSGRVEGDLVHMKAQFEFATRRPREIVPLGCQKAWPTAVALDDGKLPLLQTAGDDGFAVQVETPGPHRLVLDLDLPVSTRGAGKANDRGFELGLPRAAITLLESLDVSGVNELRVGNRNVPAKLLDSRDGQRKILPLGPIDRLEVTWKGPAPMQRALPLLTSRGQIEVRVDDAYATTEAELLLEVPNNVPVARWQLQAPPPPLVSVEAEGRVTPPSDAKNPLWTIQLKEPSAEPLRVRVRQRQPRGKTIAVGPFAIPGALRQHGKISIITPPDVRPHYRTRGEVNQIEPPEEIGRGPNGVAVFSYWNLPAAPARQPVPAPVELDLQTIEGGVETVLIHRLDWHEEGWRISTELDVTPVRTSVERLELELPGEGDFKAGPAIRVKPELDIVKEAGTRIGVLELAQKQHNHFKVDLTGFRATAAHVETAILTLPRPRKTLDRGARIIVTVPESMELRAPRSWGSKPLPSGTRSWTREMALAPRQIELSWRRHRQELAVEGLADVTIAERQMLVRQSLRFQSGEPSREIVLRSLGFPAGRAPTAEQVSLTPRGADRWLMTGHPGPLVVLHYAVPLPANPKGPLPVPLFWPENATRCEMKVRVWSDPGVQPMPATGSWDELPTELVPRHESLPSLVLRGSGVPRDAGPEFPLALQLTEPAGTPLATLLVHHQLIRASVGESGQQSYRVRYLFDKLGARFLDVELPGTPAALGLEAFLDGKPVPFRAVNEEGRDSDTGRIARLRVEPELYRQRALLDLRYQIAPSGKKGDGRLRTTFFPPLLRGHVLPGEVRWQVALPPEWLALHADSPAMARQRLGIRAGLPAPRPAWSSADLERWIAGPDPRNAAPDPMTDPTPRSPELTCWQPTAGALTVIHLPHQVWLLAGSLTFLATGLALIFAPLPRRARGAILGVLGFLALAAGLCWPFALAMFLYGCSFGLLVLPLAIGIHWFLQRRYRRRVMFMRGFSRLAPGSSIVQTGSSLRRRGEPSTVDAPPGAGV